jgi:hypothetical protein
MVGMSLAKWNQIKLELMSYFKLSLKTDMEHPFHWPIL